jgi:hypothetical protein
LSLFFCIPAFLFFFIITILLLPLLSSTPILNVYIVIAGSDFLFFYFDTKNNFRFSKKCICFEIKCKEDSIRELIVYIVENDYDFVYCHEREKMFYYGLF